MLVVIENSPSVVYVTGSGVARMGVHFLEECRKVTSVMSLSFDNSALSNTTATGHLVEYL